MKKLLVICVFALALGSPVGAARDVGPDYPAMDNCTASMIGHAVAVYNYNTCRNVYPPQACTGEQLAVTYATHQVLFWCFGVQA